MYKKIRKTLNEINIAINYRNLNCKKLKGFQATEIFKLSSSGHTVSRASSQSR